MKLRLFNNERDKPATPNLSSRFSQTKFVLIYEGSRISHENALTFKSESFDL